MGRFGYLRTQDGCEMVEIPHMAESAAETLTHPSPEVPDSVGCTIHELSAPEDGMDLRSGDKKKHKKTIKKRTGWHTPRLLDSGTPFLRKPESCSALAP